MDPINTLVPPSATTSTRAEITSAQHFMERLKAYRSMQKNFAKALRLAKSHIISRFRIIREDTPGDIQYIIFLLPKGIHVNLPPPPPHDEITSLYLNLSFKLKSMSRSRDCQSSPPGLDPEMGNLHKTQIYLIYYTYYVSYLPERISSFAPAAPCNKTQTPEYRTCTEKLYSKTSSDLM